MIKSSTPGLISHFDGGCLTLTLNRPDAANALSPELVEAMIGILSEAQNTRLCVLRAEGKHFCAGFDLSDIEYLSDGDLLWRFLRIETLLQMVHHAPFPVLALAHGQVVGAGADLFAACWKRIATSNTRFRMPGWNFELALGTRRLARLIGPDTARDLLIDTRQMLADEAFSTGLANSIAEPDAWPDVIAKLLERAHCLPAHALEEILNLTSHDSRDADMAAIVATAGRPGLKNRILNYRAQLTAAKNLKQGNNGNN